MIIRTENLQRLGLLLDIDPARIRCVGNTALAGAQLMLMSRDYLERLRGVYERIDYIELSGYPGYMDTFADAMSFPVP